MKYIKNNNNEYDFNLIKQYAKRFKLHYDVVKLLFARNLTTEEQIEYFLNPPESDFFDPFLLKNMHEVVEKINNAIDSKKRILVLGDYDTDGISASAILYKYFKSHNVYVDVFLPNRLVDGYGLTKDTIDKVISLYDPQLIITVDCGISCHEEVEYCKSKGVDIIVTDHHDIPDIIPNTLIINPKLPDQEYPFSDLCGAGVAVKLVQALSGLEEAKKYLSIASLATVADIVPLVSENRAIVFYGLKHQENMPAGILQLCKKLKVSLPLTSQDIAFKLAPKINASGRMGDASISLKLYLENDPKEIFNIICELLAINDRRVEETNKIYDDALKNLENVNISNVGAIVLHSDEWESGVLGIICSKLVEKYNKPVCLMSLVDNEYKGSCRSIPGINITDILNKLKHLLIRFGGHNQAGGLSVSAENLAEFCKEFNNVVINDYNKFLLPENKTYDLQITSDIDVRFLNDLERLQPFGLANESPVFKVSTNNLSAQRMPNYPNHLKLKLFNIDVAAFSMGDYYYNLNAASQKEILLDIYKEEFRKVVQVKGRIKSINFGPLNSLRNKDISYANFLLYTSKTPNKTRFTWLDKAEAYEKANELTKSDFGTLFICFDLQTYKVACQNIENIHTYELYNVVEDKGLNTIVFAPKSNDKFKNFTNIVYLDQPLFIENISHQDYQQVYITRNSVADNITPTLYTDYNIFAQYHNAIKNTIKNDTIGYDLADFYTQFKTQNPQIKPTFAQFVFVSLVLQELGIIEQIGEVSFRYIDGVKTKLANSKLYSRISAIKRR